MGMGVNMMWSFLLLLLLHPMKSERLLPVSVVILRSLRKRKENIPPTFSFSLVLFQVSFWETEAPVA